MIESIVAILRATRNVPVRVLGIESIVTINEKKTEKTTGEKGTKNVTMITKIKIDIEEVAVEAGMIGIGMIKIVIGVVAEGRIDLARHRQVSANGMRE